MRFSSFAGEVVAEPAGWLAAGFSQAIESSADRAVGWELRHAEKNVFSFFCPAVH